MYVQVKMRRFLISLRPRRRGAPGSPLGGRRGPVGGMIANLLGPGMNYDPSSDFAS
jgi:hypothetical protein